MNQTYQDFEIIIVDSSQTDDTKKILEALILNQKRIKYFQFREKEGIPAARNFGVIKSVGEYIAFQDDDDEWLPDKLAKQIMVFKRLESDACVGVVYTGLCVHEKGQKFYIPNQFIRIKEGDILKELLKENFVSTQTMLINKKCFDEIGMFNENLPSFEDWEFVIRLSKKFKFKIVDEPLVNAFIQTDSNSRNEENNHKSLEIIIQEHYLDFYKEKKLLSKHYSNLGHYYCSKGDIERGRGFFIKEFKIYPSILAILTLFSTFLGKEYFNQLKCCVKSSSKIMSFVKL